MTLMCFLYQNLKSLPVRHVVYLVCFKNHTLFSFRMYPCMVCFCCCLYCVETGSLRAQYQMFYLSGGWVPYLTLFTRINLCLLHIFHVQSLFYWFAPSAFTVVCIHSEFPECSCITSMEAFDFKLLQNTAKVFSGFESCNSFIVTFAVTHITGSVTSVSVLEPKQHEKQYN